VKELPAAVREFIDAAHVCRIATVRADGEPHVIPVCPVFDRETVFVDLGPKSTSAKALEHDARIAVLIDEYDDDWTKLRKVILKCRAERVTGTEQERAWDLIRTKYPQYTTVDWKPRLTMALRIYDWIAEGVESPSH
jgi:nitroimidazol reductase NimA-like FMN-containing flavoprotein (pyridoxamine 5'-phosphate oxidase superfamily)